MLADSRRMDLEATRHPRVLQVGYRKHKQQPLSEMSHTHRDFFGFV
jgi:hypothetical protein